MTDMGLAELLAAVLGNQAFNAVFFWDRFWGAAPYLFGPPALFIATEGFVRGMAPGLSECARLIMVGYCASLVVMPYDFSCGFYNAAGIVLATGFGLSLLSVVKSR